MSWSPRKVKKRKRDLKNSPNYREYKLKELKGDALARFIAVNHYENITSVSFSTAINRLTCNIHFCNVAKYLGLIRFNGEDIDINYKSIVFDKELADAYEVLLQEIYEKHGLEYAVRFFKDTAIRLFNKQYLKHKNKSLKQEGHD